MWNSFHTSLLILQVQLYHFRYYDCLLLLVVYLTWYLSVELIQICVDAEMNRPWLVCLHKWSIKVKRKRETPFYSRHRRWMIKSMPFENDELHDSKFNMLLWNSLFSYAFFFWERVTFWQPFGINLVKVTLKEASVCHSYMGIGYVLIVRS
jgi:hypothetical protein